MAVYIFRVHLSVSLRYWDTEGYKRSKSPLCLNSEETEKMYSKNLSVIFWTHLPAGIFTIKIPKQAVFMK